MGMFLLTVIGAVAEFERALIRERQRQGIEAAKKRRIPGWGMGAETETARRVNDADSGR